MPFQAGTDPSYRARSVLVGPPLASAAYFIDTLTWFFMQGSYAEKVLSAVESDLRQTVQAQHLNDYQRGALVLCVSNDIIDTARTFWGSLMFGSSSAAVEFGVGVCREYATITNRLFESIGLTGGVQFGWAFGEKHVWNWLMLPSQGDATFWVDAALANPLFHSDEPTFLNRQAPPTPCQLAANGYCVPSPDDCPSSLASDASCAGSSQGSQCCTLLPVAQ
jgi:hypothetical protein